MEYRILSYSKTHETTDIIIVNIIVNSFFLFFFLLQDLKLPNLREAIHKEIMEYHEPRTPTFSFNACLRPVPKSGNLSPDFVNQSKDKGSELEQKSSSGELTIEKPTDSAAVSQVKAESPDKPKSIVITKANDDEIFKKPLSAKNSESPVRVKTENLIKVESTDVEMLSAKSTDGRQPMSATVSEEVKVSKENKDPVQAKDDKNKTISEDTKNLIKAALMNASFKKRTGKHFTCDT